jgi:hypothetical protein
MTITAEYHPTALLLLPVLCFELAECDECPELHFAVRIGWLVGSLEIAF